MPETWRHIVLYYVTGWLYYTYILILYRITSPVYQ